MQETNAAYIVQNLEHLLQLQYTEMSSRNYDYECSRSYQASFLAEIGDEHVSSLQYL